MNAAAANALLKTLEEPPPGTYLILVSDEPGRMPATLRSRCRKLAAPLPGHAEARAWLAAQGVAAPDLALAQAAGAPLRALAHRRSGRAGASAAPGSPRSARRSACPCRRSPRASTPAARTSAVRGSRTRWNG